VGLDSLGRRMHTAAAGRRRLQTRGTRTSGHMSRRPPAHDNPVARKEVEVGAGAGHPARARSGRLFTGESAETSAIQSKRSQRKKKTAVWSAPCLIRVYCTPLRCTVTSTEVRRVLSKERKEEERESAYRVSSRLAGRADKEDSKHHQQQ
jgi:hypothetical protein